MKMNERRVPRVSRMVSEWFREVPDDPGIVWNGPGVSGMVLGIYGRFGRTRRLWKVPEGSGVIRTNERSPDGSIIGAATFALKGKASFLKRQGRFYQFNSDSQKEAVFG